MPKKRELNEKQRRFAHEYLVDSNATQAALRAGYSKKTAYSIGGRLLKHVEVKRLIAKLREPILEKAKVTGARVLEEIALVAFVRMGDYAVNGVLDFDRFCREQPAAVAELTARISNVQAGKKRRSHVLERKLKTHDKLEALGQLGRHFKLFATDVGAGDVPRTKLPDAPAAPRKIHEYTTEELRRIVQDGRKTKARG